MTNNQINDIIQLLHDDWLPYNNQPENFVYENLNCKQYIKKRPAWVYKGEKYLCLGCPSKCMLLRPSGFQIPLPIKYPKKCNEFKNSPSELVNKKETLTVQEAAYCLNISVSRIYKYIYTGELTALRQRPRRIKSEDVKRLMNDFDE